MHPADLSHVVELLKCDTSLAPPLAQGLHRNIESNLVAEYKAVCNGFRHGVDTDESAGTRVLLAPGAEVLAGKCRIRVGG